MLRRLASLVLALCFGLFSAESLVADVHDGDATHAELVSAAQVAGHVPHADGESAPGQHERGPDQSGHPLHACHCAHAHGTSWTRVNTVAPTATVQVAQQVLTTGAHAPSSDAPEPRLRPPIA